MRTSSRWFRAAHLHQPDGWLSPGYMAVDDRGDIVSVSRDLPPGVDDADAERLDGFVLPGMPNVHSHVHQRGLSGRSEPGTDSTVEESFWTWRTRMYDFANRLSPDDFEALAAQAFLEMVRTGYTTVGEFHYLHNAPDGQPYADPAEMSVRILAAADAIGIGLTMLPTLYTRAGIGRPPATEQRRFILDEDAYAALVERTITLAAGNELVNVGIAPHSLRAVDVEELTGTIVELAKRLPDAPIHLHVSEQVKEVDEALAGLGERPGAWLLNHLDLNERWTFIHATHCDVDERRGMSAAGVVAGLCPTTEGGLGDGIFPLGDYVGAGGVWGIGTDSDYRISIPEELRLISFVQRLTNRNLFIVPNRTDGGMQPGRQLYDQALQGGTRSLRQPIGALAPGCRADFVVLDPDDPALVGHGPETVLDGLVFSGTPSAVRDVMIGGRWVIRDRHHPAEDAVFDRYRAAIARLV